MIICINCPKRMVLAVCCGLAIWAVGAQRPESPWIDSHQENLDAFWRDYLIVNSIAGLTL